MPDDEPKKTARGLLNDQWGTLKKRFGPVWRFLSKKDADFRTWRGMLAKYAAWCLIGAVMVAMAYFTAPLFGGALALGAIAIGIGALSGVGLGVFATSCREMGQRWWACTNSRTMKAKRAALLPLLGTAVKSGVGLALAMPLMALFGMVKLLGAAMYGMAAGAVALMVAVGVIGYRHDFMEEDLYADVLRRTLVDDQMTDDEMAAQLTEQLNDKLRFHTIRVDEYQSLIDMARSAGLTACEAALKDSAPYRIDSDRHFGRSPPVPVVRHPRPVRTVPVAGGGSRPGRTRADPSRRP